MKKFLPFQVLVIVVITAVAAIIAIAVYNSPQASVPVRSAGELHVSDTGAEIMTNVPGEQLQQAAPPANSATRSDLSPQQAQPNYCADGEVPVVDGCVAR